MPRRKRLNKPFALSFLILLAAVGGGMGYLAYRGREIPYDPHAWNAVSPGQKARRCRMRHDLEALINQSRWNRETTLARLGPADHVMGHRGRTLWRYDLGYPPGTLLQSGRACLEIAFDEQGELVFARTSVN